MMKVRRRTARKQGRRNCNGEPHCSIRLSVAITSTKGEPPNFLASPFQEEPRRGGSPRIVRR